MDPDPDPAIFVIDLQDANKKGKTYLKNSAYHFLTFTFTFDITFTSFFKNKKSKRSHKTVGIKGILTFFA
jgi:hypothetical protein